jgi:hypothetical protein
MNEKIKHIIIDIVIVLVVPFGLFYLYMNLSTPSEALYGSGTESALVGEGQKFLGKLNELNGLKLDTEVFQSAAYRSLVDTSVPPPTEGKGRTNPFIPPASPIPPPAPSTTQTKGKTTGTAVKNLDTLVGGKSGN